VIEHGGDWTGQHSGLLFVPEQDFALTMLTNSTSGPQLTNELFYGDWALQQFAGLDNPPAVPARVSATRLAEYEGNYVAPSLGPAGEWQETTFSMHVSDGALQAQGRDASGRVLDLGLEFYRGEYVVLVSDLYRPLGSFRANFVRGTDDQVAAFSFGGRLYTRQR